MAALNAEQRRVLLEISDLVDKEAETRKVAQAQGDALVAALTAEAVRATNERIAYAHRNLSVSKSAISAFGLGTQDRRQVYERLAKVPEAAILAADNTRLTVEHADSETGEGHVVIVHLANFYHPDLGADLTGTVVFEPNGDVVRTSASSPTMESGLTNPLWTMTLWGLPDVQAQA